MAEIAPGSMGTSQEAGVEHLILSRTSPLQPAQVPGAYQLERMRVTFCWSLVKVAEVK
jgi:hypothetical protein